MGLSKADWELTENEFKNQRVQLLLQMEINSAVLQRISKKIKEFKGKLNEITG